MPNVPARGSHRSPTTCRPSRQVWLQRFENGSAPRPMMEVPLFRRQHRWTSTRQGRVLNVVRPSHARPLRRNPRPRRLQRRHLRLRSHRHHSCRRRPQRLLRHSRALRPNPRLLRKSRRRLKPWQRHPMRLRASMTVVQRHPPPRLATPRWFRTARETEGRCTGRSARTAGQDDSGGTKGHSRRTARAGSTAQAISSSGLKRSNVTRHGQCRRPRSRARCCR